VPDPDAPILEFDPSPIAVIEPNEVIDPIDIAPRVVLCFFQDVIEKVVAEHGGRQIDVLVSEIGQSG
jgi:uridine phosphorylase